MKKTTSDISLLNKFKKGDTVINVADESIQGIFVVHDVDVDNRMMNLIINHPKYPTLWYVSTAPFKKVK